MNISFMDIGTHCWTMKDDCAVECVVVAVRLEMFFGSEREHGFGDVQLLSDKTTIESGIIYTLEKGNHNGDYFKRNFDRVFMSKQELINSL